MNDTLHKKYILYLTKDVPNDIQTHFSEVLRLVCISLGFIYRTHKYFFIHRIQFSTIFFIFFLLTSLYELNVLCKYFLLPFVIVAIDIIENDKISWFSAPFKCKVWELVVCNNRTIHPSSSLVFLKTHPLSFIFMDIYLFMYLCINRNELYKNIPSIIKTDLLHFLNDVLVFFFTILI